MNKLSKAPDAQSKFRGTTSPVQIAIEGIDAMITAGRLIPGQRLAEGDLSEELGVAPGRVREALRILAGQGVVELEPYKSARVRRLSQAEIITLFETITGIYCTGLVSLAHRYNALDAARRRKFHETSEALAQTAAQGSINTLLTDTLDYQQLVFRLSGNPHLAPMLASLHPGYYWKSVTEFVPEHLLRNAMGHAGQIATAVAHRDPGAVMLLIFEACGPIFGLLSQEDVRHLMQHGPAFSKV